MFAASRVLEWAVWKKHNTCLWGQFSCSVLKGQREPKFPNGRCISQGWYKEQMIYHTSTRVWEMKLKRNSVSAKKMKSMHVRDLQTVHLNTYYEKAVHGFQNKKDTEQ